MDSKRLESVRRRCSYDFGLGVDSTRNAGGLGMWWNELDVSICTYTSHHIEADILNENMEPIVSNEEKWGGTQRSERNMDEFRLAIDDCRLRDLGFKGRPYTWQRGNSMDTLIRERLDRFMATVEWSAMFPEVEVLHLAIQNSDHAPLVLKQSVKRDNARGKWSKKFESYWLSNGECERVVRDSWRQTYHGDMNNRVESVLGSLSSWARDTFGNLKEEVKRTEEKLRVLQNKEPDANILDQCKVVARELNDLRAKQESYWHIRAKANELRDGDKNTSYFHHKASSRKRRNHIKGLYDNKNNWCNEANEIEAVVTSYFSQLFTAAEWDETRVRQLLAEEEDARKVLDIPLSCEGAEDTWFWWPNTSGLFSVKSAYWLGRSKEIEGRCLDCQWSNKVLEGRLDLHGPPKLKHFLWRGVQWYSSNNASVGLEVKAFGDALLEASVKLNKGDLLTFATAVLSCMGMQEQSFAAVRSYAGWESPGLGTVRVNVDAHVNRDGFIGVGVVARDSNGMILMAGVRRFRTCWNADQARHMRCVARKEVDVGSERSLARLVSHAFWYFGTFGLE
ncbi:Protease HtpX-like protein [Bienertia sinuspersici]